MIPLNSSFLLSAGYEAGTLYVIFRNGRAYTYHGVPESVYSDFIAASSPGVYYNRYIKGRF